MALTTKIDPPLATALKGLSLLSKIQARDKERRLQHAYTTQAALLDNLMSRATLQNVPAPVDYTMEPKVSDLSSFINNINL
jgi:hypothetical protein